MISRIRKRVTFANVVMTLALVFAMSGGAYAAKRYVISSTKQISPKVVAQLRGKAGAAGAAGPEGKQGPQGPAGKDGANGINGTPGSNGTAGEGVTTKAVPSKVATCAEQGGAEFEVGTVTTLACNGQSGFTKTLPSGDTETGTWGFSTVATASKQLAVGAVSFNIPLAAAPNSVHLIPAPSEHEEENEEFPVPPAGCTGNVTSPGAAKGNLCVFARRYENAEAYFGSVNFLNPEGGGAEFLNSAGRVGVSVTAQSVATGPLFGLGTWAVTAP
jgi:hypothetical protein